VGLKETGTSTMGVEMARRSISFIRSTEQRYERNTTSR
jgi:hypothetical protein